MTELELRKQFALRSGWPNTEQYNWSAMYTEWNDTFQRIPGSFPTISLPDDCPVRCAQEKALLDHSPSLVRQGFKGASFVLGYGPNVFEVGYNVEATMSSLIDKYREQFEMPFLWGEVSSKWIRSDDAQEYYKWASDLSGVAHPGLKF